ncbi:MAG: acetyl-CoA carboxylase biotin carboxyl carrier protein [Pseudomonadota bacterium]
MSKNSEQDVEFIKALADLLKDTDLSEIEVEREYGENDELKVRLSRAALAAPATVHVAAPVAAVPAAAPAVAAPTPAAASETAPSETGPDLSNAVKSPMVGTVYLSPEPGADTFVNPGDTVSEGDTILIIEAMKTMNQIPAPRSGKVRTVLVDNAEPVEFGEPLMIIE